MTEPLMVCPDCLGSGKEFRFSIYENHKVDIMTCEKCAGKGRVPQKKITLRDKKEQNGMKQRIINAFIDQGGDREEIKKIGALLDDAPGLEWEEWRSRFDGIRANRQTLFNVTVYFLLVNRYYDDKVIDAIYELQAGMTRRRSNENHH